VRVREKKGLTELPSVAREIRLVEEAFAGAGRVLVRFSGTEPLARVMVEGPNLETGGELQRAHPEAIRREMGRSLTTLQVGQVIVFCGLPTARRFLL